MFEKLEACPVCSHTSFSNHIICDDHSVSGESFALVKCRKCSLLFTNPRPSAEFLDKYYESDDYISHTNTSNSLLHIGYKVARWYMLHKKERLIRTLNQGKGQLLDFGCGTGHFLKHCKQKGWIVSGIEPNHKANVMASKLLNQPIHQTIKDSKTKFDLVTAWHVLEHVPDPMKTIKALRKRLTDNGHLVIAVPNHLSFDAMHYKDKWAGFDVPRHLFHFNQESFQYMAKRRKLKIVNTLPLPLDAYYVSWLSEKYSSPSPSLKTAINIARTSNKKAKESGEYSSLIYILRKQ